MAATVTVTGKIGPAEALSSTVISNVTSFNIDSVANILTVRRADIGPVEIDITAAATITATKSSSTYTLAVS